MINNTICNVQPSQKIATRVFSPLPYSKENLQILNKIHFRYSDIEDTDYFQFCKIVVENKNYEATHRNDVGKTSNWFRIRLKVDGKLKIQRHTKTPVH